MKASELARPPMRNMNPNASSSINSPSTSTPIKREGVARLSLATPQSSQSQDQQQPHDSSSIYVLFTSSVIALVSYILVRDHKAVALNYRTFISKPSADEDEERPAANSSDIPRSLTNVRVFWASSGTLVISLHSQLTPDIHCLGDSTPHNVEKYVGACMRVAPNGLLAKIISFDDPLDTASEDISIRPQRKRVKIGPVEQGIEKWKAIVTRWLKWKGYLIPDLEKKTSWVRIRIGQTRQLTAPSPGSSTLSRDILWPRALCFVYGDNGLQSVLSDRGTNALNWYETPNSAGFKDPIDVAQQWFMGKPERDKILDARRRAKKAEEEAARPKEEVPSLYPSSPLNSRTGAYGDLQAVSGVYPTPPDGILPGTVLSNSDTPSVSGATMNTLLAPGGPNPAINLSAPQDNIPSDGQQQPPTSPDFAMQYDQFNTSGGNDDLFEDDEDGFEGTGVTDVDFDFFDEPDDDDVDMVDASASPHVEPTPEKKSGKGKPLLLPPKADVKEDGSDPLAALEDALATASNLLEATQDIQVEQQAQIPIESVPMVVSQSQSTAQSTQVMNAVSKEPTPPLSPHLIQKTLFSSPKENVRLQTPQPQVDPIRRESVFDPVSFNSKLTLSDAKYKAGRFSFLEGKPVESPSESNVVAKHPASLRNIPLLTKLQYAIRVASTRGVPEVSCLARGFDHESDLESETSSTSEDDSEEEGSTGPEPPSAGGFTFPAKRKLPTDGAATPMSVTSYAESWVADQDFGLQTDESALTSFEPDPWDWSLSNVPGPTELQSASTRYVVPSFSPAVSSMPNTPTSQPDLSIEPPDEKPLSPKDSIAVAQIVTDQIVSATLDIFHDDDRVGTNHNDGLSLSKTTLQTVVKSIFPKATDCDVLALVSIQDVFPDLPPQNKGQQRPPPRRTDGPSAPGYHMHAISPPHIRVRRADVLWDLLPPALAFWEPLGLSPCSPAKNIVPFCLYPHSESIKPCVESFLINMQLAYDACKLGTHARVDTIPEYEGDICGGLVPCRLGSSTSTRGAFKALRDACVQLGKLLAARHAQLRETEKDVDGNNAHRKIDAFVIYMINPFSDPTAIWELCSAFWTLFQTYGQSSPNLPNSVQKPDLVLQVVPIKYIASFSIPVILSSNTYSSLAREVYDRCPPSQPSPDKTPLSIYSAPSFQLEESLPRAIPFKLISEPPQDLFRENSYMHVGYSISLSGEWLTAAWTDSCGKSQAVVTYQLGMRSFSEVAREIWGTTVEICSARRVTWRVCVARSGVMEREEVEAWVSIASCPTQLNLFITLLTVDVDPPLTFTPTLPSTNATTKDTAASKGETSTPATTPQPGVSPSQDNLTPAPTPSATELPDPTADPEARFVDQTDESWGIILAHRLHNSNSTVEFRPCLISGLLVKRGVPANIEEGGKGMSVVGVNILWVGAVGSSRAAVSPFPTTPGPTTPSGDYVSAGGGYGNATPTTPGGGMQERSSTSLMWTPTAQTRATAENLLKEILAQFRGLTTLAKLRGARDTNGGWEGGVPWHIASTQRGVEGLGRCLPS
jgi:mediator of RNA polymerase II transcription subunit 13